MPCWDNLDCYVKINTAGKYCNGLTVQRFSVTEESLKLYWWQYWRREKKTIICKFSKNAKSEKCISLGRKCSRIQRNFWTIVQRLFIAWMSLFTAPLELPLIYVSGAIKITQPDNKKLLYVVVSVSSCFLSCGQGSLSLSLCYFRNSSYTTDSIIVIRNL